MKDLCFRSVLNSSTQINVNKVKVLRNKLPYSVSMANFVLLQQPSSGLLFIKSVSYPRGYRKQTHGKEWQNFNSERIIINMKDLCVCVVLTSPKL